MGNEVKMSAPWITFYKEVEALFEHDADVRVFFDEDKYKLTLSVDDTKKAEALSRLMPFEKDFGNITVNIEVVPANKIEDASVLELFDIAFGDNDAFWDIKQIASPVGSFNYAIWSGDVVQFYNDNMRDIDGKTSMLYENIAKDVFGDNWAVFHCTERV